MTPESTLLVIAQIAATFIGFTALVSVVDQSQGGRWARISIWRIIQMLQLSLILLFLCLIPAILTGFGVPEPLVWQIGCALLVANGLLSMYRIKRAIKALKGESAVSLNETIRKFNTFIGFLSQVLLVVALTGLTPIKPSGAFLYGIASNLLIISLVFFALIQQLDLQRVEQNQSDDKSPAD